MDYREHMQAAAQRQHEAARQRERERHEHAAELAREAIREAEAGGDLWRARSYAHTAEILAGDLDTEPHADIPLSQAWQAIKRAQDTRSA